MAKIIGIDLGTEFLRRDRGWRRQARRHREQRRRPHHPSDRRLHRDGEVLVGASAKRQAGHQPKNTFYAVEAPDRPQVHRRRSAEGHRLVPYAIVAHDNGDAWVALTDGKNLAPQEISALRCWRR